MNDISANRDPEHQSLGHIVPASVLLRVWVALVVLTAATVVATYVDMGRFNLWLALLIAAAKATLVILYFMHLRYDSPFNAFIFIVALLFVALFIIGTVGDTEAYQQMMQPPGAIVPP